MVLIVFIVSIVFFLFRDDLRLICGTNRTAVFKHLLDHLAPLEGGALHAGRDAGLGRYKLLLEWILCLRNICACQLAELAGLNGRTESAIAPVSAGCLNEERVRLSHCCFLTS